VVKWSIFSRFRDLDLETYFAIRIPSPGGFRLKGRVKCRCDGPPILCSPKRIEKKRAVEMEL